MPHFVTSRQAEDHVASANAAHLTAGLLGNGCYVLPLGQKLACTMTDSNTLRVLFGVASVCGRQWEVEGDYEEVNIDNGVPGYNRVDLLVCRIETAPQETIALKVYKGEETTGTPVTPGHVEGDLNDGDTVCEMPICSVRVNGINPQAPVMLTEESIDIMELLETLNAHKEDFEDYKSQAISGSKLVDKSVGAAKLADGAVTSAKIAANAVATAALAAKAVTAEKLADNAVSAKLSVTYYAQVADFGTVYVLGGKIGVMLFYCKKTAAMGAWGEIAATLPGGVRAQNAIASQLLCEDRPGQQALGMVDGGTVRIQNRSSTAWPASTGGYYIRGSVVFPVA